VSETYRAPRNDSEDLLCKLFAEITGAQQVSIDDGFFALGGDSISAIRLVSRVRVHGYQINVRDIFKNQSPALLAPILRETQTDVQSEVWEIEGDIPALPIYLEYLSINKKLDKFNQTVVLQVPQSLSYEAVCQAYIALSKHHGALRLRTEGNGLQTKFVIDPADTAQNAKIEILDLTAHDPAQAELEIHQAIDTLSDQLNPEIPGSMKAVLWVKRKHAPTLLVLTLHHFVVDGVSWRILLDDLKTLTSNPVGSLPERTMSLRAWAQSLSEEGRLGMRRHEESLWLLQEEGIDTLPQDHAIASDANTQQSVVTIHGQLNKAQTDQVVQSQAVYHGGMNDILLAALGLGIKQWGLDQYQQTLGDFLIALEGHGRENDTDLSQTVGWLTSIFPLRLEVGDLNPQDIKSPGHAIRRIKDRLRSMPDKGLGYGVLRYLDQTSKIAQSNVAQPQLVFNYLGRSEKKISNVDQWSVAEGYASTSQDAPDRKRLHLIDINANIDATGSLQFNLNFCSAAYSKASMERLLQSFTLSLNAVAEHCLHHPLENTHTPSDYPLTSLSKHHGQLLDQRVLDQLVKQYPDLEDIVPLTPSQQGLAFESMARAVGSEDPYHIQIILIVQGKLEIPAMQRAWSRVIKRHAILRLRLAPSEIAPGLGIIGGELTDDQKIVDLHGDYAERLDQIQKIDLEEKFSFEQAPLVRLRIGDLGHQKHALLISKHHLILDGWSLPVLMRELAHIYDCDVRGLPEILNRPFIWQEYLKWLAAQDIEVARRYWSAHLSELTEPSRLQLSAPNTSTSGTGALYFNFDQALNDQFEAFSKQHGLTQASVLMGLYALVLGRTSQLSDIVIGSVHNGRANSLSGIDQAIGLFIDTLPLFMHLPAGESLVQWLLQQQTAQSEQDAHSHIGLAAIQSLAGFPGSSIFEALFVFENFPTDTATIPVGDLKVLESLGHDGTNYPLALGAIPGNTLSLRLTYDLMRIKASDAQHLLDCLCYLIQSLPRIAHTPLAAIALLEAPEEQQLINQSKGSVIPADASIADLTALFAQQVSVQPDLPALMTQDQQHVMTLSYAELDARTNQLARHLINEGIGPGQIIALLLERSEALLVSTLAVLKTGAAYLPLDPGYPPARLEYILKDSKVQCVISNNALYDALQSSIESELPELLDFEDPILEIRLSMQLETAIQDHDRIAPLHPQSLAYLIYTSGSTGQPKAVGISHLSAVNLAQAQLSIFKLDHTDRVLQFASQAFDASVWEMLLAFGSGAALVIPEQSTRTDAAARLALDLQTFGVTHATLPPVLVAALDIEVLKSLNTLVVAGEACSPEIVARFASHLKMFNAYGPTETTVCATISPALNPEIDAFPGAGPVTIGQPLANMQVFLLDPSLQPVQNGMQGELYVAGTGLARGYIGRPGLTAERFVACPFGEPGMRMYRTGDMARRRDDGAIEFIGRKDDQVKIHGYRIELGEIESAIRALDSSLTQVAVIAREMGADQKLVAYIVQTEDQPTVEIEALKQGLAATLPEYMVPNYFVTISELPFTPNGKLDRRTLPAPSQQTGSSTKKSASSKEEQILCEIFETLTNHKNIGVDDHFFALGGDSISVIRLVSLARAKGLLLTVRDVFTHQSPEALAAIAQPVEQASTQIVWQENGVVPALPVFQAFWEQKGSLKHFNQAVLLDAPAHVSASMVKQALEQIRAYHGALRLRCEPVNHGHQLVIDEVDKLPPIAFFELDLSAQEPVQARQQLIEKFLSLSDDLDPAQPGALMVGLWITQADGSHQLALVIHHYAVDGVSWRVLIDDLQALTSPEIKALPAPSMSLRAWAETLASQGLQGSRRDEEAFWLEQIQSVSPLPVKAHFDKDLNTVGASETYHCTLSLKDTERLVSAPSIYQGGINDLFLAALGFSIAQWSESRFQHPVGNVVVHLEGHGRELDAELSRTVGWLTTVFPVSVKIDDLNAQHSNDLGIAIQRVKEILRGMADKGLGYGILKYLDPNSQLSHMPSPGIEIGFNYLGRFEQSNVNARHWNMAEGGLIGAKDDPNRQRMHVLDFNTAINPSGCLTISITFSTLAHDLSDVEDLAKRFQERLVALSDHCLNAPLVHRHTLSDFKFLHQNPDFASHIDQGMLNAIGDLYPDFEDIVPLTPLQQGLAFESLSLEDNEKDPYHVHLLLTFTGQFDSHAMQRAWRALVKRHIVMRLAVAPAWLPAGLGIVLHQDTIDYQTLELTGRPEERIQKIKEIDFQRRYDLAQGPLIRFYEAPLGPHEWAVLISNHHLILDGWSLPILTSELAQLYEAECAQVAIALDTPFEWRNHLQWLADQDFVSARDYWKKYLGELTSPNRLDLPIPKDIKMGMANIELALDESTSHTLEIVSRQQGVTQASLLQGLFALVLARRSKLDEIVIGSVRNGRTSPLARIDRGTGLFINTLPMFTTLHPGQTLIEWVREQQIAMADQDTYGHIGLREIQHIVGMTGTPLFEAMFVFENYPVEQSVQKIGQLTLTHAQSEDGNHYPIGLSALTGEVLTLRLGFDQTKLDLSQAQEILEQVTRLIRNLPDIIELSLAAIPLVDVSDRKALLESGAGKNVLVEPSILSILDIFDKQFAFSADKLALSSEDPSTSVNLTFGELNARANQLARHLISRGVGPDDIVGIMLDPSAELVVSLLGVMRAGAAYLPLATDYPTQRLAYMLHDSQAKQFISTASIAQAFQQSGNQSIPDMLDLSDPAIIETLDTYAVTAVVDRERKSPLRAENLAYLIYTSGSTGLPKGVALSHSGLVNYVSWAMDAYKLDTGNGAPINTSIAFDATITSLWLPLISGKTVHFLDKNNQIEALAESLQSHQDYSLVKLTPVHLDALRHLLPSETLANQTHSYVIGGEQLTAAAVEFWRKYAPGTRLINEYGPTEAVVGCCVYEVSEQTSRDGVIPIGMPIWNTQLYLLDPHLDLVSDETVGELYIGGSGLARGYLGRPGLTSERFIACPFGEPGARMYRTGDLARRREDGVLVYLGRVDDQVKIRGYRIELGEIETALLNHIDDLAHAVVITKKMAEDLRLVAYLVPITDKKPVDPATIKTVLGQYLPEHMIPTTFITIDALPLTPNGKLDRSKLPEPIPEHTLKTLVEPKNERERIFCTLFESLTGCDHVNPDDSFFAIGGDSILSIRLVSRARSQHLIISVKDIFKFQTPAELAHIARSANQESAAPTWPEDGQFIPLPIYHDFIDAGGSLKRFNQTACLIAPPAVSFEQVGVYLQTLMARHAALRMRTVQHEEKLEFLIDPWSNQKPSLKLLDLTHLEDQHTERALTEAIHDLSMTLSPEHGQMVSALWVCRQAHPPMLVLTIHHYSIDGVSWRILIEDLNDLLSAQTQGAAPKTMSFIAWCHFISQQGLTGQRRREEPLWLSQVQHIQPLPTTFMTDKTDTLEHAAHVSGKLTREITTQLLRVPDIYFGGINDVLLAALGLTLSQWSWDEFENDLGDPVIMLEGHGREGDQDVSKTVGWFTTSFPLRLKVADLLNPLTPESMGRAIQRVKESLHALPDKGMGYGILRHLDAESSLNQAAACPPQVLFNYLGRFEQSKIQAGQWSLAENGLTSSGDSADRPRLYALEINAMINHEGAFVFGVSYSTLLHSEKIMTQFAKRFETMLELITAQSLTNPLRICHTPSDFTSIPLDKAFKPRLDQQQLDTLLNLYPDVEDIIPLTALQQGLAYESSALEPAARDPYHVQIILTLHGKIHPEAMWRAWTTLTARHSILRLAMVPAAVAPGFGVIRRTTGLGMESVTLTGSPSERKAALLQHDLSQPFSLETGPLARMYLCELDAHSHALLLSNHHLILDGWSSAILGNELSALYEAERTGSRVELEEPFNWQDHLQWVASQDHDRACAYWKNHLSELTEPSRIEFPPPSKPTQGMGEVQRTLSPALSEHLNQVARELMVTQATLFQGMFALLLGKMNGLDEIVLGCVRHGRSSMLAGIDRALGLFINTLPFYHHMRPGTLLADWLRAQQSELVEQEAFEHLGLTEIQALSGFSSESLFDALFVFENYPVNTVKDAAGELVVSHAQAIDGNHYPIALSVVPGESILLRLTYDQSRLDHPYAQELVRRLQAMLEELPSFIHSDLTALPLTTGIEREEILERSSGPVTTDRHAQPNLVDLLSAQALNTPERIALSYVEANVDREMSYGSLDLTTNRLARHFIAQGIGPDQVVAIMLDRSPELILAILAVLKAGGSYLPLDSSYPNDRLNYMLENSKAAFLISTETLLIDSLDPEMLENRHVTMISKALETEHLAQYSASPVIDADRHRPLRLDDLAYVIYTSGSTGRPKGVGFVHGALSNLILWQAATVPDLPDCVLQYSPISFDVSAQEIIATLTRGAKLVLIDEESRKDGFAMLEYLDQKKIDVLHVPYVVLSNLAQASQHDLKDTWPAAVITAGEQLKITPEIRQIFSKHPETVLHNHYGPTETHVVSAFTLSTTPQQWDEFPPIGKPIWNTRLYILDPSMNLVPDGVVGELYIAGISLARGYLNKAALTSERFIANPYGPPGSRMYRTGDLARRAPDGDIDYVGRVDDQVKIRGFRVELGEVEAALLKLIPQISQVAVIASVANGHQRLIAYIVMNAGHPLPDLHVIRAWLTQALPDYMVPAHFIDLPALPLTPNGKLDRRSLPEPSASTRTDDYASPRSAREAYLCRLFAQLTGTDPVGIDDSFFNIGGHSLLAMQLVSHLKLSLGIKLNLRVLFEHPTPRQLAANLETSSNWTYEPLLPLRKTGTRHPIFCIHPGGGTGTVYQNLKDALPEEYPVWTLQARGLEEHELPHANVSEMATAYIAAIREVQTEGPYHLLGWSFGGTIAQEMTVQLEALSQQVSLLVLLDTVAQPSLIQLDASSEEEQANKILESSAQSLGITDEVIDINHEPFIKKLIHKMSLHRLIPESTPPETFKRTITQMIRATQLTASHSIKPCEAPIIFVRAGKEPIPEDPSMFDWSLHTQNGVSHVEIQSSHSAMWETQPSIAIANVIVQHLNAETSVSVIRSKEMDIKK
jgi:amino acid adenylation domain-containing protein/non-ribosomal peptide synthase protein (TIGR01720 family)